MDRATMVLWEWMRSVPAAVCLMACGKVRRRHSAIGQTVRMSDGRHYDVFRETVKDEAQWARATAPAVLHPRFQLRGMPGPARRWRHALFRRACIVMTPTFVGRAGFRSKRWMVDPETGEYAGLYEWDDARSAQAYADGLCRVLRRVSVPGSVTYELVPNSTVRAYLLIHEVPALTVVRDQRRTRREAGSDPCRRLGPDELDRDGIDAAGSGRRRWPPDEARRPRHP